MHPNWEPWLERGRAILDAPPLTRAEKAARGVADPKWALGDLLIEIPEHLVDALAQHLGQAKGSLHRLRDVAEKWPTAARVAASWSAHRDLKDHPDRFALIRPGMSVREAAEAAGKKPIDAKPRERMTVEEKATEVVTLLTDKAVNDLVLQRFSEQRDLRRKEKAVRAAADERSAEYREARRRLNEAQAAKSPDRVFLEVIFRMQEAAEYLRAVVDAAADPVLPLIPEHRKPDLMKAIENVAAAADSAMKALADDTDVSVQKRAVVRRTAGLLEQTDESSSDQPLAR